MFTRIILLFFFYISAGKLHLEFNDVVWCVRVGCCPLSELRIWVGSFFEFPKLRENVTVKYERFFLCVPDQKQCKSAWLKAWILIPTYFPARLLKNPNISGSIEGRSQQIARATRQRIVRSTPWADSLKSNIQKVYGWVSLVYLHVKFLEHLNRVIKWTYPLDVSCSATLDLAISGP